MSLLAYGSLETYAGICYTYDFTPASDDIDNINVSEVWIGGANLAPFLTSQGMAIVKAMARCAAEDDQPRVEVVCGQRVILRGTTTGALARHVSHLKAVCSKHNIPVPKGPPRSLLQAEEIGELLRAIESWAINEAHADHGGRYRLQEMPAHAAIGEVGCDYVNSVVERLNGGLK